MWPFSEDTNTENCADLSARTPFMSLGFESDLQMTSQRQEIYYCNLSWIHVIVTNNWSQNSLLQNHQRIFFFRNLDLHSIETQEENLLF